MELPQFLQEIAGNSLCFNAPAFGWLGVSRIMVWPQFMSRGLPRAQALRNRRQVLGQECRSYAPQHSTATPKSLIFGL